MIGDKKTVLIVDDEQNNIFALSAVLIPRGYTCTAALNGEQCLKILGERTPFNIILMDIMMPQLDGLETIRIIRNLPQYKFTKIIVVTADDSPSTRLKSMASGADGFLNKPIDIDKLISLF